MLSTAHCLAQRHSEWAKGTAPLHSLQVKTAQRPLDALSCLSTHHRYHHASCYATPPPSHAFAAAALLAQSISFIYISESKTRFILGTAVDLGFEWTSRGDAEEDRKIEIMTQQSSTLRGLESMVWALISLDRWRQSSEKFQ